MVIDVFNLFRIKNVNKLSKVSQYVKIRRKVKINNRKFITITQNCKKTTILLFGIYGI